MTGYKDFIKKYLKEQEIKFGDGKTLNISIQVSEPDKEPKLDDYEDILNDEHIGINPYDPDDVTEQLYQIEKSINIILASCVVFEKIQTYNSVVNPNTNELMITVTTKEDDDGITEQFYNVLKDYNERINKFKGFTYEVTEDTPNITLGGNGINSKNKTVTVIRVYKGNK